MTKTPEQVCTLLDANIPRDAVESRDAGQGRRLSYLSGWYVIDRMNQIFGPDGWSYDVTELRCVHQGRIMTRNGEVESASYVATVQLFAQFPGESSTQAKRLTDVGFGNGTDKSDPGKPHELATKEAVTDAIKRCAKSLGMSLGLALYTKDKDYIDEAPKTPPTPTAHQVIADVAKQINDVVPSSREALNKRITAMSKVVIAKRLKTIDELKADMKSKYGADSTAGLDDAEAKELLATLEGLANG